MKFIYAFVLFTIPFFSNAQSWQRKNVITGSVCSDVIAMPSGKLVSITTDGVYGSSDNAQNWQKISSDIDADLNQYTNDVEPQALYLSNDTLYAYFRSKLFRSTNEGVNWSTVNTTQVRPAYESTFGIHQSNLFLTKFDFATNLSTIYISKDAGNSWTIADTISAHINIFNTNNEIYLWGYYGSLWTSKSPLLKKLDVSYKLISVNTTGLPTNSDIRGMSTAGNNLVLMIPEYNQSSTIIATKLFGYNGTTWIQGTQFTENYSKLYSANGFCFQPFFNSPKVLRSKNGIDWTNVPTSSLYGYYSSIRSTNTDKMLASNRAGVFELDSNFNKTAKNNGMFASSLSDMLSFKQKIYVNSSESGLYVSTDEGTSFSAVNISNERTGSSLKNSSNQLYLYNAYLMPNDKVYTSVDGSTWDTLVMPSGNFSMRQLLCVSDNGVWASFTESNVKSYKFYNEQTNTWADVSSAVPSNASYFNTYKSVNGKIIVVNTYYENNIKKTAVYELENNAGTWKSLKHTMGDVWYENTSIHNNDFYFLKNAYNKPDSLFKVKNDSLVFEREVRYGNFKFYTDNFYESFFYRGNEIYCLGFDSVQQNTITMIRSINGGATWEAFNKGMSAGAKVSSLYFGNTVLASTSKGLYEYGNMGSFINREKNTNVSVYPNPAKESVSIKMLNKIESSYITIYNINGVLIHSQPFMGEEISINTSSIPNGIYVLKINSTKGVETSKFVVQH